jgi:hypothetical protein
MAALADRNKMYKISFPRLLLAAFFLNSVPALAICTTLATDRAGSLKAGYLSNGAELSTGFFPRLESVR